MHNVHLRARSAGARAAYLIAEREFASFGLCARQRLKFLNRKIHYREQPDELSCACDPIALGVGGGI